MAVNDVGIRRRLPATVASYATANTRMRQTDPAARQYQRVPAPGQLRHGRRSQWAMIRSRLSAILLTAAFRRTLFVDRPHGSRKRRYFAATKR